MAQVKHFKVTELPDEPIADAIYYVNRGTFIEEWVTANDGTPKLVQVESVIALVFDFDGGGAPIAVNSQLWQDFPFPCTLIGWAATGLPSGSIKFNVWKCALADFPPTSANSITGGHDPEISEGDSASDADLSNWTDVAVAANDILFVNVESRETITRAKLTLRARRKLQ